MVKQEKIETVKNLIERLKLAKSFVLLNYAGLRVEQLKKLKGQLEQNNSNLKVVKNALLSRALSQVGILVPRESLTGPTAILTSESEDFSAFKILDTFIKEASLPKVKIGFWDNKTISETQLLKLTKIPTREELIREVVNYLSAPVYNLNFALNYNLAIFINTLEQIKVKKS